MRDACERQMKGFVSKTMNSKTYFLFIVLFAIWLSLLPVSALKAQQADTVSIEEKTRTLINLLDYIGKDYPQAVTSGRVINDFEFREMKEFQEDALAYYQQLADARSIEDTASALTLFSKLREKILQKADEDEVADAANKIRKKVLNLGLIDIAPQKWPDMTAGKEVYRAKCASCHGKNGSGEGPASQGLEPPPSNFLNEKLMGLSSPFKSYNVARLGIPETSMRAFDELSDEDVWDVAFYINSLQFRQEKMNPKIDEADRKIVKDIPLEDYATLSNNQLKNKYVAKDNDITLADIRLYEPAEGESTSPLAVSKEQLQKALALYKDDKREEAAGAALSAYLDGVEPVEKQIRASEPALVGELEDKMMKVRSLIKNREDGAKIEAAVASANTTIDKANKMLNEQEYSFWFVLFLSGSIILREGLEALLIVIAILAVLRSVEAHLARKWVHAGWATAIVLGIVSWFFADYLVSMGMKSIEMIEGIGALVAVFILVYIGFWLHNKTHAANWKAFIDEKVKAKLNSNNMLGLAVVSFIVVFREAFETILFLTSLNLEVAPANKSGIGIGVGGAAILVLALGYVMTKYARKIPISKFFKITSVAISILAVVLAGKGIHALQEGGIIPISSSLFSFRLSLIGFYPTLETIAAQSLVIALVIILWNWSNRSAKAASAS
ncbi:MAG: hypothetical protein BRD50_08715 [Bacteroidetes bacterium SW_11_45_7]|nr:MAG: hypothetical protein BRD50_08715 [Bacteroidetes bacterium SW_11_45_7]